MPISISITYIIHITCIYTISYLPVDHLNFQDPGRRAQVKTSWGPRTEELGEVLGVKPPKNDLPRCWIGNVPTKHIQRAERAERAPGISESVGISEILGRPKGLKPPGTTKKESTIPKWPASVGPDPSGFGETMEYN